MTGVRAPAGTSFLYPVISVPAMHPNQTLIPLGTGSNTSKIWLNILVFWISLNQVWVNFRARFVLWNINVFVYQYITSWYLYKRGSEWPSDRRNIHALLHSNTVKLKNPTNQYLASRKNQALSYSGSLTRTKEYKPRSYSGGPGFEYQPRGKVSRCSLGFKSPNANADTLLKTGRVRFHLHPSHFISHNQNIIWLSTMIKQGIITLLLDSCYRLIFMEGRVANL